MKPVLLFLVALCTSATIKAQSPPVPKWMSEKGFWVIQSNLKSPKNSTIYFYNNDQELVYKEEVNGKRINTDKLKTRKHLESVLVESITTWKKEGVAKENQQLVVTKP
jgi:hypothetical protein